MTGNTKWRVLYDWRFIVSVIGTVVAAPLVGAWLSGPKEVDTTCAVSHTEGPRCTVNNNYSYYTEGPRFTFNNFFLQGQAETPSCKVDVTDSGTSVSVTPPTTALAANSGYYCSYNAYDGYIAGYLTR